MPDGGKKKCSCTYTACERNGKCEECKKFHKDSNSLTGCERLEKARKEGKA